MPKPNTFPTLFDETKQVSIQKLSEWGYLKPNLIMNSTLTWSIRGNETGSISLISNTKCAAPYIELDYKYNDEPRNYNVQMVSIPSNLDVGIIWYFLCPITNKRCRKLYSVDGYFLHREAFKGCMYESQTRSKLWRQMEKTFGKVFRIEDAYDCLYSKHFKKHYKGKPTKKYLKLISIIKS